MRGIGVFTLLVFLAGCGKSPQKYVDAGNRFLQAHKLDDASINFRSAIQKDPNFADAYFGLGKVFLEQGKAREAYVSLNRAVELAPQNLEAKQKLATLALAAYLSDRRRPKNLYDQLNKLAADFLKRDPNSYDGLRLKAYLALTDNQRADAIGYFQKTLKVKPGDPEMTVALAGVLFQENTTAGDGEKLLTDLIRQHKEAGSAYDALYRYYSISKRPVDAENILKSKVAANPKQTTYILQLAEHYRRAGKAEDMKAALATLLNDPKAFPKGLMSVGDFYTQIGNRELALQYYQQGAKIEGADQLVYQKRAVAALNALGRTDQALAMTDAALQTHGKDPDLHMTRALLLLAQRKADPALTELQQMDQNQQKNPAVKYQLGRALLLKGKVNEATAAWQESAKLQPNFVEPKMALGSFAFDSRRYDEALNWADQVIKLSPGNLGAQILRSNALQGLGRVADAKTLLTNLRQQLPGNAAVELEYAFLTLRENKAADAEKIFRTLYTPGQENIRPLTGLAEALFAQKKNDEALHLVQNDLVKAPDRLSVQMLLANGFLVAGQPDSAVHTLEQMGTAHPDLPQVPMRLGQIAITRGNTEAGLTFFQKAAQLAPQNTDPILAKAEAEERLGRIDAARQDYQAVLKVDATNLVALNNLAYMTADTGGNLEDALRMIKTASQKLPKQPNLSDTLGYVYLKQKNVGSALQVFGDLAHQYPTNATFRFHHALALIASGSKELARKELEAALADKPSPDLASKIRQALGSVG